MPTPNPEQDRLNAADSGDEAWKKWGPYLADRAWGTVREDYSAGGSAWAYFPFWHAHRRAFRWNEDGIAGISDDKQRLCVALAVWNGRDPLLKERFFGLANEEGNHGEDVKEAYFYLDATPTHSYLKFLYKYPQAEFPYARLYEENRRASRLDPEVELHDLGAFAENRYFDVMVEYAKATPNDILMRITATNHGPEAAPLHLLPHVWFRNTWSWDTTETVPMLRPEGPGTLRALHLEWDDYRVHFGGDAELLVCNNETNPALFGQTKAGHWKDAIHEAVVRGNRAGVNPEQTGTKAAGHYRFEVPAGQSVTVKVRLRLTAEDPLADVFADFDSIFTERLAEAETYFTGLQKDIAGEDERRVHRQAIAGLIWTKQFFHYDVWRWLKGDPASPPPPPERKQARNADWQHLRNGDIISMPDKWEYPWYAAWDLAFHCVPFATFDPTFAKDQLLLFLKERYMHPNGQLPAYEWNFGDANPPVHGWATWRVFQIDRTLRGDNGDLDFLERAFHKLMLNFTWWVNRKDANGRNVFQGGFLGLDNIGVFDRSRPLPTGGYINQADATGWMAMYSLNLMRIALELARHNPTYEDIAIKFFEHFLAIAAAMTNMAGKGIGLWDDVDKFYYDELTLPNGHLVPLRVRSTVGLIPLFAVEVLDPELLAQVPAFAAHMRWVLDNRPDLAQLVSRWYEPGRGERRLLSLLRGHRMKALLRRVLDPQEFLADHGIRSLSKFHKDHPYEFRVGSEVLTVDYQPAEATIPNFGGNSNWRGPIWLPMNYLLIESLFKFHHYYGDDFQVECPTGSGQTKSIRGVAEEIAHRVCMLFLRDSRGRRASFGPVEPFHTDPLWKDHLPFYEYFHADTGQGLGAAHQTGWTAVVAKLLLPTDVAFADLLNTQ
ncbi:MAG: MGH1-like glycoside hydrolase domain-containing protein [Gemmataceae bacterium]